MKTRYYFLLAIVVGLVGIYIGLPLFPTLVLGVMLSVTFEVLIFLYKFLGIDSVSK